MSPSSEEIVIYGTSWCYDTRRVRTTLENRKIAYRWVDIDKDTEGRDFVMRANHGNRSVPTILFPDGSVLTEPSENELLSKLNQIATY